MQWCKLCENMLYMRHEDGKLIKYCKNTPCPYTVEEESTAVRVSKTMYIDDELLYRQYQNPYLRFDPTLPRVNNIPCANPEGCPASQAKGNQVLYIKYDPVKMLYLYCCDHCGYFWRPQKN